VTEARFCEKNLTPVYVLLIVLAITTVGWVFIPGEGKGIGPLGRKEEVRQIAEHRLGPVLDATGNPDRARAQSQITAPAPAPPSVDANSVATPNGGIRVIAFNGGTRPFRRRDPFGNRQPRMQLLASGSPVASPFNTVAASILPSVVSIRARRDPAGFTAPTAIPGPYQSVGSGFVIDGRGFVLTNEHVVTQATHLLVGVSGKIRTDFPASVVALDRQMDLALLRITGPFALPQVSLGESRATQVGDWVLAFGSPFGLDQTVTEGIISSKRQSVVANGVYYGEMLQTDAPINRGSSGGPLVSLDGQVIGMNTAIYGPDRSFSGTGFAIPVDRVKMFLARSAAVFNQ